jgi:hypothetical protein
MIQHQFRNNPYPPPVGFFQKVPEIPQRAIVRIDAVVIGNIIPVISQGGRIERLKPDDRDPQIFEIIKLLYEPPEIACPVVVTVKKTPYVELVNDGILVPEGVIIVL